MAKASAGVLLYRRRGGALEVFLVHPGGPFWAKKDRAAWSIPKGEFDPAEDALAAARREFQEETGLVAEGDFRSLAPQRQPGGKVVHAFALEGEADPAALRSNSFEMEWPPRSGRRASFPEVDRAAWFPLDLARAKIHRGQVALLDALQAMLAGAPSDKAIVSPPESAVRACARLIERRSSGAPRSVPVPGHGLTG